MKKEHIIFNSDTYANYTDDDIIQNLIDCEIIEKKEEATDNLIYDERDFLAELDFNCEMDNLNKELPNDILCIASLGLWDGRKCGYKILKNNLNNILTCTCGDYYKVYFDGYNIKARDCHHDGTNYYTFRLIKDNVNIDNLLNKLYNGTATQNDINNYTYSLKRYIKNIYGW